MSEKTDVEINGGPGCLFFFAAIIIGIAVGNLHSVEVGWLSAGLIVLLWALMSSRRA